MDKVLHVVIWGLLFALAVVFFALATHWALGGKRVIKIEYVPQKSVARMVDC